MADIATTVDTIAGICANGNAAGLKKELFVTTEAEIDTIPAATELVVSTNITMESGGLFKSWGLSNTPEKNGFLIEDVSPDGDSSLFKVTVTAVIPKLNAERIWAARGGCNHILIVQDMNGTKWLIGEKGNGCAPKYKGEITGSLNQATVVFEWYVGRPPYTYTGTITLS